jgi:glycosyltransferase involved in cell wall biosynthesis
MVPILSVLLPTRNNLSTLQAAIRSILSQSPGNMEVIVIDSGHDGTAEWLNTLADSRVVYLYEERRGLGTALNSGLAHARAPLVARMDADDVALPGRFGAQLAFLESHPEVAIVGTQFTFLIGDSTVPATRLPLNHEEIRRHLLRGSCVLCHPTIMFRAEIARRLGGYRIPGMGEELDFFLRLSECGQAANLTESFHLYRLNTQSASMKMLRETSVAHAWAMECASLRAHREVEPSFLEFAERWNPTVYRSLAVKCDESSREMHRRHLLARGMNHRFRALSWLAASCVCSPKRTALHLRRLIGEHFIQGRPAKDVA